jgi:ketosteroid isomerase-like protein
MRAMSKENVEIVRSAYEGFLAGMEHGDPGGAFDAGVFAEDFEWIPDPEFTVEGEVFVGREGFIAFVRMWTEQFEDWSFEVERVIDAGDDRVVALTHQSGTGAESGVPVELDLGQVWELRGGRLARTRNYLTHAKALEAVGLSE